MKRPLIVGGASGVGLALAHALAADGQAERIDIVDRNPVPAAQAHPLFCVHRFDLQSADFSFFDRFADADGLLITAGFGRLAHFADLDEAHITASLAVNTTAVARLLHRFYPRLLGAAPFPCLVMGSIAGFMGSPLYAIYGASKAALKVLIESLNVELEMAPSANRILHVAPGNIAGTAFHDNDRQPSLNSQLSTLNSHLPTLHSSPSLTDLEALRPLAAEIIDHLRAGHDRFIPHFDEVYAQVLERAHQDFREEGRHSYRYKIERLELRVES